MRLRLSFEKPGQTISSLSSNTGSSRRRSRTVCLAPEAAPRGKNLHDASSPTQFNFYTIDPPNSPAYHALLAGFQIGPFLPLCNLRRPAVKRTSGAQTSTSSFRRFANPHHERPRTSAHPGFRIGSLVGRISTAAPILMRLLTSLSPLGSQTSNFELQEGKDRELSTSGPRSPPSLLSPSAANIIFPPFPAILHHYSSSRSPPQRSVVVWTYVSTVQSHHSSAY